MGKPTKKRLVFDFGAVEFCRVSGEKIEVHDFHQVFAETLHNNCPSLGMLDVAMQIYKGEKVELSPAQRNEIISVMQNQNCGLAAFARKAVIDFLRKYETID